MDRTGNRREAMRVLFTGTKPLRSARGFTLVELITAIVILGILAAVVGPRIFDNRAFSTRGYADEVAASLRYAQAIAAGSGCEVAVSINAGSYQAMQRAASVATPPCDTAGAWVTPVQRTDGSALSGAPPTSVTLTPDTQIVFDTLGRPIGGAIALQVGAFNIAIDAGSGFVSVQ